MRVFLFLLSMLIPALSFVVNSASSGRSMMATTLYESKVTGTVKWFNTAKGFGFIKPDDDGPDVFVHQTAIEMKGFRSLADGEQVEYVPELDKKSGRVKATKVTGPNGAEVQGAPFRPSNDYDNY